MLTIKNGASTLLAQKRDKAQAGIETPPFANDACALAVRIAKSWQEVENLRAVWEPWTNGLATDIDYFLQNLKNDWTILHPYVISIWKGETPLAILVAHVKIRAASAMVSMIRIRGPRARLLEIVPDGRLGPPSTEVSRFIVRQLSKALRKDVDMLCFHGFPLESDVFHEARQIPGFLVGKRLPHVFSYTRLKLAAPLGQRSQAFSGKIMREARRKTSNLQRAYPGRVSFKCFSKPNELEAGLSVVESISHAAWQHSLAVGLTETLPTLEGYRFCAKRGWLRIYALEVDGQPCAYLLGQLHNRIFYCQRVGYHPDYAEYSVGSILTHWAFEDLAVMGTQHVDLGEGSQEHNRRLGCEEHEKGMLHVYAPTIRGLTLNGFFGITQAFRVFGRHAQWGLHLNWVGRAWKQFLNANRRRHTEDPRTSLHVVPKRSTNS